MSIKRKPVQILGVTRLLKLAADARRSRISELKTILDRLDQTFITDPAIRKVQFKNAGFVWPQLETLNRLSELIFCLAASGRNRPIVFDKAVDRVNRTLPKLQLEHRLVGLMRRDIQLGEAINTQLLRCKKLADGFMRITDIACQSGPYQKLARMFVRTHSQLEAGKLELWEVKWDKFKPLFGDDSVSIIKPDSDVLLGSPSGRYGIKYLEITRGWKLFKRAIDSDPRTPFIAWLEQLDAADAQLIKSKTERGRRLAAERQRRKRYPLPA